MDDPGAGLGFGLLPARVLRYRDRMGLTLTLSLLAACLAVALFAGWRGARPPDPMRGPRLVPWSLIMTLAACGALVFLVHLLNLLGLQTGR